MRVIMRMEEDRSTLEISWLQHSARFVATWLPNTVHPQREANLGVTLLMPGVSMSNDTIPIMRPLAKALLRWKRYKRNVHIDVAEYSDDEEILPW